MSRPGSKTRAEAAGAAGAGPKPAAGLPQVQGSLPRRGLAARRPRGNVALRWTIACAAGSEESPTKPSAACHARACRLKCQQVNCGPSAGSQERGLLAGGRVRLLAAASLLFEKIFWRRQQQQMPR